MRKFLAAALAGLIGGAVLTTQVAGPLIAQEEARSQSVYQQLDLFGDVFERIRAQYVNEVETGELIEAAINGMLMSLDPHSSFLSPDDFEDMRVQTRGAFGGLGIEISQQDGFVRVIAPIDDTPADQAGVQAGDLITHVDGESLLGLTLQQAVEKMRGPVGSEIVITIVREGVNEPFDLSIIRDTIRIQAVRTRTEGDIVVLRVTTFNEQTYDNLRSGLQGAIDDLGGIDVALKHARALAEIGDDEDVPLVRFPPRKSTLEMFITLATEGALFYPQFTISAGDIAAALDESLPPQGVTLRAPYAELR